MTTPDIELIPLDPNTPIFNRWKPPCPDWYARDAIHLSNWPVVEEQIYRADLVVAAWGSHDWANSDIDGFFEVQMMDRPVDHYLDLYCLGTTKHGHPKHPMARGKHRVTDDQQPALWRGDL